MGIIACMVLGLIAGLLANLLIPTRPGAAQPAGGPARMAREAWGSEVT